MSLSMSKFANSADYWKARAELVETTMRQTAEALGCEPDYEAILAAAQDAERYRFLRDDFSVMSANIDGQHSWAYRRNFSLRGPTLDAAIDASMAQKRDGAACDPATEER